MYKILLIFLFVPTIAFSAENKLSFIGSMLYNTSTTKGLDDLDGVKEVGAFSIGAGIRALIDINSALFLRTGAQVIQKTTKYEIEVSGLKGDVTGTITYLAIPLTLYKTFNNQFGVFGGLSLQSKLGDTCNSDGDLPDCEVDGEKSLVTPLVIGMDVNINSQVGLEFSYEYALNETYEDVKVNSLIASFLYHF